MSVDLLLVRLAPSRVVHHARIAVDGLARPVCGAATVKSSVLSATGPVTCQLCKRLNALAENPGGRAPKAEDQAAAAVRALLRAIGEDPAREGLIDTPRRVVAALAEMTACSNEDPAHVLATQFTETYDEMVIVRGVEFTSVCEHHLMPFVGTAALGYVPNGKVVGLSKLARLVEVFARRLQIQERMTQQIAGTLMSVLGAKGAACIITARHACMGCRGVRKPGAEMVTSTVLGVIRDKPEARAEFLELS